MFVSDKLIFTELQKTGGSHILRCLEAIINGQRIGKHNRVPENLRDRFVVGSVRNPWDWYVSLWGYGCAHQGGVFARTTQRYKPSYYWRQLNKEMGQTWLSPSQYMRQFVSDTGKPVNDWRATYSDSNDPVHFRRWLKMILTPERKYDVGEGFGFSPVSHHSGLLTYRYLKLFTSLDADLYSSEALASQSNLRSIFQAKKFVNQIIRNEHLETDLILSLENGGVELTEEQRTWICAGKTQKTNTSAREGVEYYYDQDSIELIKDRESLIIEMHDYKPPQI
jgi:hypothetical protein